jgi:hypothetical protein
MQRRKIVSMLSVTAAGAVASRMAAAMGPPSHGVLPGQYDDFAAWLVDARAAGMNYLREFGSAGTERFMKLLSIWACAMPDPPDPNWQAVQGANKPLEMAMIAPGQPFVVSAFRMAPGCILPLHCHPGGGGITLCTSGSLAIQHFELVEDQPPFSRTGAQAEVRQVQCAQLTTDQATLFTPTLANLHQFHAGPEGATGVEIAVQWKGAGEFSFLKLRQPLPVESFQANRRLEGNWVGMQLAAAYP